MERIFWMCNFAFSNCYACDNRTPKRSVIKLKLHDYCMPKINMTCVAMGTCKCTSFTARPDDYIN